MNKVNKTMLVVFLLAGGVGYYFYNKQRQTLIKANQLLLENLGKTAQNIAESVGVKTK
jgi:hypothetical protein